MYKITTAMLICNKKLKILSAAKNNTKTGIINFNFE